MYVAWSIMHEEFQDLDKIVLRKTQKYKLWLLQCSELEK